MAKRNAGLFSKRKTKKVRRLGTDAYMRLLSERSRVTKAKRKAKRNAGPMSKRKTKKRVKTGRGSQRAGTIAGDLTLRLLRGLKRHGGGPTSATARHALRNPLPIGKLVTVKARRRPDGKIDLFKAR